MKKNNGYFFSVNHKNVQLDALVSFTSNGYNRNDSWSTIWKSQVRQEGNKTVYEIAIPLKILFNVI